MTKAISKMTTNTTNYINNTISYINSGTHTTSGSLFWDNFSAQTDSVTDSVIPILPSTMIEDEIRYPNISAESSEIIMNVPYEPNVKFEKYKVKEKKYKLPKTLLLKKRSIELY